MKILITGATGFVGRHLIPTIIKDHHEVLELTRSVKRSQELFGNTTIKLEISDKNFKEKIVEFNPDVVIHLASFLTSSDKLEDINKLLDSNIYFLTKVLDSISQTNLKLFINTGSFSEYQYKSNAFNPAYFYAATKTASRAFVDYYSSAFNFKQCTIVPFTIYGGKDSQKKIIDIIYDSTNKELPTELSPGDQILDFIHIDDITHFYNLVIKNIELLPNNSNFKIGTGIGYSLKDIAKRVENITNRKANINWGGKNYRKSDVMYAVADISNIEKLFSWKPKITINDGLIKLIAIKNKDNLS